MMMNYDEYFHNFKLDGNCKILKPMVHIKGGKYYIDFYREGICNYTGDLLVKLPSLALRITRFLCLQSQNDNNGIVTIDMLYKYLYPDDPDGDIAKVSRAMSNFRSLNILSTDTTDAPFFVNQFIDMPKNGKYKILLDESAFIEEHTETREDATYNTINHNPLDIELKILLIEILNVTTELDHEIYLHNVSQKTALKAVQLFKKLDTFVYLYKNTNPLLSLSIERIVSCFDSYLFKLIDSMKQLYDDLEDEWIMYKKEFFSNLDSLL